LHSKNYYEQVVNINEFFDLLSFNEKNCLWDFFKVTLNTFGFGFIIFCSDFCLFKVKKMFTWYLQAELFIKIWTFSISILYNTMKLGGTNSHLHF
jgi:hypothetical protein